MGFVICLGISARWRADSIFIGAIERTNAVIKEVKGDVLVFEINARQSEMQAGKITPLVPSEAPPEQHKEAYASGKWDQAVDGYQKTIRTASKPWVRDWAAIRLIDAASKSGRFDAAVAAYVLTLLKDPAAAASLRRPSSPSRAISIPPSKR